MNAWANSNQTTTAATAAGISRESGRAEGRSAGAKERLNEEDGARNKTLHISVLSSVADVSAAHVDANFWEAN